MRGERTTVYALTALVHLGQQDTHKFHKVLPIAQATGVPVGYLRKLLGRLVRAKIVISTYGAHGGFTLARPAHKITLLQIVEALEGPVDATSVLNDDLVSGRRDATARRLQRWRESMAVGLHKMLEETTLGDLVG